MAKHFISYGVLLPVVLAALFACGRKSLPPDTNVIIVLVDTLRNDRLGINGHGAGSTPCMDRLAREGVLFKGAVAPSSWTKPSVASLLTGLYPGCHGAIGDLTIHQNLAFLEERFTTMAERFKTAGYKTAAFVTNANIIPFYHFDQGFDEFTQPAGLADELLGRAAEWVKKQQDDGRKFFLYLHLIDPHAPYFPPPVYRKRFAPGKPLPKAPFTRLGRFEEITLWLDQYIDRGAEDGSGFEYVFEPEQVNKWLEQIAPGQALDDIKSRIFLDFKGRDDPRLLKRIDHLTALYDGEVAFSDTALDGFVENLRDEGVLDESVLVVTSDHGECFMEHDFWGHRLTVHREEIDVPLIFRVPGPEGDPFKGVISEQVSLIDIFPTLMEMLDLPETPGLDGVSLWPAINGADTAALRARPVFTESFLDTGDHASVVLGRRKLMRWVRNDGGVKWMYYDLERDPEEQEPMRLSDAGQDGIALKKRLERFFRGRRLDFNKEGEMGMPSAEEIEQLRKLGYL